MLLLCWLLWCTAGDDSRFVEREKTSEMTLWKMGEDGQEKKEKQPGLPGLSPLTQHQAWLAAGAGTDMEWKTREREPLVCSILWRTVPLFPIWDTLGRHGMLGWIRPHRLPQSPLMN